MSKIGKRVIPLNDVVVSVDSHTISYKGSHKNGTYELTPQFEAIIEGKGLLIRPQKNVALDGDVKRLWGMHRALVNSAIMGSSKLFEKPLNIVGLGFKVAKTPKGLQFSLGYSHKIDFELPANISVEIDKTGQQLIVKSSEKGLLGLVCSKIRALRAPEPYKGTGVQYSNEVILRKAGKTK